jgi:hypothetical protein
MTHAPLLMPPLFLKPQAVIVFCEGASGGASSPYSIPGRGGKESESYSVARLYVRSFGCSTLDCSARSSRGFMPITAHIPKTLSSPPRVGHNAYSGRGGGGGGGLPSRNLVNQHGMLISAV